ncbi:MAG: preprotein translocase subunit SecG [Bryobacterales bacterium]|nr:preprotein translocase subunit SecG [Bryobacterales bacterium]MDE0262419.1 preprotein translocase subunit SecG [Bryobacterales bacterium]MDE0621512.1 preprotein translocase subunit SecG [Bryobacterales bacterium]
MVILLTTLHILVSFFLIIVVLLQSGKAADLAGAFGGMGSQTAFGPRGAATVLSKATTTAAVLFMLTSITLGIWQGRNIAGQSVIDRSGVGSEAPAEETAPAETEPLVPATSEPAPAESEADGGEQ